MNKINLKLIKHVWMNPQLCQIWGHNYSAARQQRNVLSEVYKNKKNAQNYPISVLDPFPQQFSVLCLPPSPSTAQLWVIKRARGVHYLKPNQYPCIWCISSLWCQRQWNIWVHTAGLAYLTQAAGDGCEHQPRLHWASLNPTGGKSTQIFICAE